jgi:hypothetical protein
MFSESLDRFKATGRLSHHCHIWFIVDKSRDSLAQQRVIIDA